MSDSPAGVDNTGAIDKPTTAVTKSESEQIKAASEYSKVESNGSPSMKVKVQSPFRDYYDGQAFSLTAENETGPFDILPKHHSFISLLSPCEVIIRTVDQGEQKIRISGGIMHVKTDRVIVFLDV